MQIFPNQHAYYTVVQLQIPTPTSLSIRKFKEMSMNDEQQIRYDTTRAVYPTVKIDTSDANQNNNSAAMTNIELQQLIIKNQLQGTEHDNILKTQNLSAEQIQIGQEIEAMREENFRLKDIISKINSLDSKKAAASQAIVTKAMNEQNAQICKLLDRKQKLLRQQELLDETYDPNEKIHIDEVPGMDRIKALELDVEKMKLKLNEAQNINLNFSGILQGMKSDETKFNVGSSHEKQMLLDADAEFANSIEVRKQAEEACQVMEANYEYRLNQVHSDTEKRAKLLIDRKEQVKSEKEKTDYICSQQIQIEYESKTVIEDTKEQKWSGASEYYRENVSGQVKINNPWDFLKLCAAQKATKDEDKVTQHLKEKIDEQVQDMNSLKNRILDTHYEIENNRSIQRKQLVDNQDQLLQFKQTKDQAYTKYQETRHKAVYLKTALSSVLDKLGAVKLVPEDQINLMLGDDVLIDSLSSADKRVFDSFVGEPQTADAIASSSHGYQYQLMVLIILSKIRWLNELYKQLDQEVENASLAQNSRPITQQQKTDQESIQLQTSTLTDQYTNLVLDDEEDMQMNDTAPIQQKITFPSSRPGSAKAPMQFGGKQATRQVELNAPPQTLNIHVIDRAAMKKRNEDFAATQALKVQKEKSQLEQ